MATLPKSGFTANSPKHYLLNAGAVVHNLTYVAPTEPETTGTWTYEEFGATSGGSTLSLANSLRQMEIDGVFSTPVGGDQIESSEATMELNLLEYTADNIKAALIATVTTSDGTTYPSGYDIIEPKQKIETTDYIQNLAYIGTYGESELPIIVIFHYAICTSGLEMNPQDNNDNVYPLTFSARMDPEKIDTASMPVTILLPTTP